jgi:hypothetical protein
MQYFDSGHSPSWIAWFRTPEIPHCSGLSDLGHLRSSLLIPLMTLVRPERIFNCMPVRHTQWKAIKTFGSIKPTPKTGIFTVLCLVQWNVVRSKKEPTAMHTQLGWVLFLAHYLSVNVITSLILEVDVEFSNGIQNGHYTSLESRHVTTFSVIG